MLPRVVLKVLFCTLVLLASGCANVSGGFITRDGHRLMDGSKEFRFAGIHAPELHRIEDDSKGICAADPRGWGQYFKWPTELEQENWIKALVKSGHKAMRVYVLSVATPYDEACGREVHILPPKPAGGLPRLNESAMVHYDRMIHYASKHNLRLILPFIDYWKWWGGKKELADFYGEPEDALYDIHSKTYVAYLNIIKQVINRTNTITGRLYRDEPAIMAWETGNELKDSNEQFVTRTAAYIKLLDPNHLLIDGTYLKVNEFALRDPNIDIISNHFYSSNNNNHPQQVIDDLTAIAGKKVYLVGEFGLIDAADIEQIMRTVVDVDVAGAQAAGAFVWGFRGRREEGGFYWHKEWTGHYSYHLPGFSVNDGNEERQVIEIVRRAQANLEGQDRVRPLPSPEPPLLHGIVDPRKSIRWMGPPLGRTFRVERAEHRNGPWTVVGDEVEDGQNQFNPEVDVLFFDHSPLQIGKEYFYRVFAINEGGESRASNVERVVIKGGEDS